MDILTILAGMIIVFIVGKNVVFSKNNSRKRNRQITAVSAVLTIVFNIVSYFLVLTNKKREQLKNRDFEEIDFVELPPHCIH